MAELDGLPTPQRHWSTAVIWVGLTMAVLDTSIANVALPTLASELHATAAESVWVLNAFQIGILICLFPVASLADIIGYQRTYVAGMALFARVQGNGDYLTEVLPAVLVLGLGLGMVASFAVTRVLQSMLFGTKPLDPAVLFGVIATLLVVAMCACLVPAWRASRIEPMQALRME